MKLSKSLIAVLAIVAILVIWLWSGYNGLVTAKAGVDGAWANVETNMQRRMDLVPNLVSTVKGAAKFEQETFEGVTAARSQWQSAATPNEKIVAANQFESALSRLLVTVEAYPQLQATQAFRDLMTQLEGTENRIAVSRRDYNGAAQQYNVRVARFPSNILAGLFSFDSAELFAAQPGAEDAPKVEF